MEKLYSPIKVNTSGRILINQRLNLTVSNDRMRDQAMSDSSAQYLFFMFINPSSGSNKAQDYQKLEAEKVIFSTLNGQDIHVEINFYNVLDTASREKGLNSLKSRQDERIDIRVIVGGGDGTIMWIVEEMIKFDINFTKCPIAPLPFGTGNDLARALGWGGAEPDVLIGTYMNGLKKLIRDWIDSMVEDLDIWDVDIRLYEEGGIKKIYKENGKKFEKRFLIKRDDETGREIKVQQFRKKMCNYYSFGVDARIGYGFDKLRTSNRIANKMIYCWEGFKKMFMRTFRVNHLLDRAHDYFEKESSPSEVIEETKGEENNIDKIEYVGKEFLLYPSNSKYDRPKHATIIKGDPSVFLCLNIPSYMGGGSNPWAAAKGIGKVGATNHLDQTLKDFQDQRFGDGKLEIISFSGPVALAMEVFLQGQGRRVGQSKGPFFLTFKRNVDVNNPFCTYMQVDGEYYEFIGPKSVRISLSKDLPNGKIKVLVKRPKVKK